MTVLFGGLNNWLDMQKTRKDRKSHKLWDDKKERAMVL